MTAMDDAMAGAAAGVATAAAAGQDAGAAAGGAEVWCRFRVPGPPQGKGRARVSARGGMVRMHTPAKTVAYEGLVAMAAGAAMAGRPPEAGPLGLALVAVFAVPASWSKRRRDLALAGQLHPAKKPDLDNVLKAVGDACNGVVWLDDSQLVEVTGTKRYGASPGLEVVVWRAVRVASGAGSAAGGGAA